MLEEKISLLANQLSNVKNDLLFSEIERIYDKIEIFEKLILDSKFNLDSYDSIFSILNNLNFGKLYNFFYSK
jgi:hypothetical protein